MKKRLNKVKFITELNTEFIVFFATPHRGYGSRTQFFHDPPPITSKNEATKNLLLKRTWRHSTLTSQRKDFHSAPPDKRDCDMLGIGENNRLKNSINRKATRQPRHRQQQEIKRKDQSPTVIRKGQSILSLSEALKLLSSVVANVGFTITRLIKKVAIPLLHSCKLSLAH